MEQRKFIIVLGGLLGAAGVALGAFGAHGLEGRISAEALDTWDIATRYHLIHAVALLALCCAPRDTWRRTAVAWAGWLWVAGCVIFAGSLYLLVLTGAGWLGAITPIGGVAFILGWVAAAWALAADRGSASSGG
jgi:uncharacterized membrane protein YgdD (TMEM256/DUF423 family)